MKVTQFKNGNLHIRREKGDAGTDGGMLLYFNSDLYPVGEEYCISNYATALDWCYNGGSNYYRITSYNLEDLKNNKTIILKPHDDEYVKEFIIPEMEA